MAPPYVTTLERQVADLRHLSFASPVTVEPVSKERMAALVREQAEAQLPMDLLRRRGLAWQAIGVLPPGTDLPKALVDLLAAGVSGFYDPDSKRLAFVASESPSLLDRFVLAHELTHALDDQNFDLSLLERLNAACRGEQADAYQALVEGNAVETSVRWAWTNLSDAEREQLTTELNRASSEADTGDAPPFLLAQLGFPYEAGQAFVEALEARGGQDAVDDALRHPPVSTEQVIHPDAFPDDRPTVVTVPNVGPGLAGGWRDLDRQAVGEAFLQEMLALHESSADAEADATGWAGGAYRSWTDGSRVAVVMVTAWDSAGDAERFATAAERLPSQGTTSSVVVRGATVTMFFGSDAATRARIQELVVPPPP